MYIIVLDTFLVSNARATFLLCRFYIWSLQTSVLLSNQLETLIHLVSSESVRREEGGERQGGEVRGGGMEGGGREGEGGRGIEGGEERSGWVVVVE